MKTTNESYQHLTNKDLEWNIKDCEAIMKHCKQIGDMETYHIQLKARRNNIQELKKRNEDFLTTPVSQDEINILNSITPINIDEKIQDFKITNFYEIVSKNSSFNEAYYFVKNNYTKKELILIDDSIPDYEGYNWTKKEGIRHLISLLEFNIAS